MKAFHQTLQELLKQTSINARKASQRLGAGVYSGSDEIDRSVEETGQRLLLIMAERDRKLIADINLALKRIENGRYGICETCEENISPRRLKASPTATLCTHCQQAMETNEKLEFDRPHAPGSRMAR